MTWWKHKGVGTLGDPIWRDPPLCHVPKAVRRKLRRRVNRRIIPRWLAYLSVLLLIVPLVELLGLPVISAVGMSV